MRSIPHEDQLVVMPALGEHTAEFEPGGAAQVCGVALQLMAVEIPGEQPLAEGSRLRRLESIQTVCLPGLFPRLHDRRREILAELIGVHLKPTVPGRLERERECRERPGRAEPDVAALAHLDVRLEYGCMAGARAAVAPVCRDDEVGIGECALILPLVLERLLDTEFRGALLQHVEQSLAAYAAEAVPAAHAAPAVDVNCDVIPVVKARDDRPVGLGVG